VVNRYHFILLFLFVWSIVGYSNSPLKEKEIKVAMRMIGHEFLLNNNDSTSRVLPIKKIEDQLISEYSPNHGYNFKTENGHYLIQFDTEFEFDPDKLVTCVQQVMAQTRVSNSYVVEVQSCASKEVVYSYAIRNTESKDFIPCKGRVLPLGCYQILFTLLNEDKQNKANAIIPANSNNQSEIKSNASLILIVVGLVLLVALVLYYRKRKNHSPGNSNLITLGAFLFDKKNMELLYEEEKTELTYKETEVLSLLHSSANKTVTRETLLSEVWGDEGVYVGRTLDVFISKLRKKLEPDPSIKISNIRGIGYQLILND
tara:strand:- start:361 stop:1305 length:945 start_codon:yes stop_codon:yes gene_type:complete